MSLGNSANRRRPEGLGGTRERVSRTRPAPGSPCRRHSRHAIAWLALAALLAVSPGTAKASSSGSATCLSLPEAEEAVRGLLNAHLEGGDYPGAAAGLHIPGEGEIVVSVGSSDPRDGGPPLDPDQPLNIGSITKTFVAVVVLQLVQSGDLDLDADIARWFPDLPDAGRITVRHLLQHTSGMNDYLESPTVLDDAARAWTPEEQIEVAIGMGSVGEPGGSFHYTNTTYIMLGTIIEEVTGRPWYEEVRGRITGPLDMNRTAYAGEPSAPALGPGYRRDGGRFVEATRAWHPTMGGPAGALVSTPSELLRFMLALRGGRLLNEQRLGEMKDYVPAEPIGHVQHAYGLGFERYVANQLTLEGHMGTGPANAAFVGSDPITRVAVAVQINVCQPGLPAEMAAEILAAVTGQDVSPPPMPSAGLSFGYLPATALVEPPAGAEDLEVQINTVGAEINYPTSYRGGKTQITHGLRYQQLNLNYENRTPGLGELVERAHMIRYSFVWFEELNSKWSLLTMATPGLASDFDGDISFDDAVLEVAVVGIYNYSDRTALGFGAGFNPYLGQHYPMPVLAVRWNNGVNMELEAILPMSLRFGYRPHPVADVGLSIALEGSSYHGDPEKFAVDNPQMRYSLGRAGPSLTLNLLPFVKLSLEGGVALGRRFEFYDGLDEEASYDLDPAGYFQGRLSVGQ